MFKKSLIALALMGAAVTANAASTNLVQNGSFEANAQASGTWHIYSNLTGWTGGSRGIELRNNVSGTASDGHNFVELDTTGNSSMSQTINTVLNQKYVLTFDFTNRPGTAVGTNGLSWSFGSASGYAPAVTDFVWHTFTTSVLGTGAPMVLNFAAAGPSDSYGSSLDKVSVAATPIPAAVWLFGTGIASLFGFGKRKKINNSVNA
jgi:hypothetical protein